MRLRGDVSLSPVGDMTGDVSLSPVRLRAEHGRSALKAIRGGCGPLTEKWESRLAIPWSRLSMEDAGGP